MQECKEKLPESLKLPLFSAGFMVANALFFFLCCVWVLTQGKALPKLEKDIDTDSGDVFASCDLLPQRPRETGTECSTHPFDAQCYFYLSCSLRLALIITLVFISILAPIL